MAAVLGVLAIIVPLAELAVFALVSDAIGIIPTVLLLVLISLIGFAVLIQQGIETWRRLREAIRRRVMPGDELADAAVVTLGGALLVTPGFLTDVLAFFCLLPGPRAVMRRAFRKVFAALATSRLGWMGTAGSAGKKIYDVRATRIRRSAASSPTIPEPQRLPSSEPRFDEDDSPDTG